MTTSARLNAALKDVEQLLSAHEVSAESLLDKLYQSKKASGKGKKESLSKNEVANTVKKHLNNKPAKKKLSPNAHKKATGRCPPGFKSSSNGTCKKASKSLAAGTELVASIETWEKAHAIMAAFTPNLRLLRRKIARGVLQSDEVVAAVLEALKLKRVPSALRSAVGEVLHDALLSEDEEDVIDLGEDPDMMDDDAEPAVV